MTQDTSANNERAEHEADQMSEEQLKQKMRGILEDGDKVREGVRELVLGILKDANMQASRVRKQLAAMIELTGHFLMKQGDAVSPKAYSDVMGGIGDALESSFNALNLSLKEAGGKGQQMASEELKRLSGDVGSLLEMLGETVTKVARDLGEQGSEVGKRLNEHLSTTKDRVSPVLSELLETIKQHPTGLPGAYAGSVLNAVGSALSALGKKLGG